MFLYQFHVIYLQVTFISYDIIYLPKCFRENAQFITLSYQNNFHVLCKRLEHTSRTIYSLFQVPA
jgi:hypothetical protein